MKSATLRTPFISGSIFGIFGAGGKTGKSILKLGINDGGSGNVGGSGIIGIEGNDIHSKKLISSPYIISRSTSIVGGSGKFGNCGREIFVGIKFIFGKMIFMPSSICDMSI